MADPQRTYPPGVPCWIDTRQPDPAAAATFYAGLFGWTLEDQLPPGSGEHYLVARLDGADVAAVASAPDGAEPAAWVTYVTVASADDAAERARAAGGVVVAEPVDVGPAGRMATIADPAGALIGAWEPRARTGAGLVNAPGTWNWSDLHTGDPQAALAFYPAVFGWVAQAVDMGGFEATMWCVPGYGDFQAERDPSLRERHADPGVPEGFSDAIGWLIPSDGAAPARWHVTFAVADTDAVAARAVELGGTVLEAPHDLGPTRLAELQDPAGARFTISHYQG